MPDQVQTCFSEAILTEIPHLRAYATLMTNNVSRAHHGVTETLKHAFTNREGLCQGTGLRVQLLTILRNLLVASEPASHMVDPFPAIYERLKAPFRIISGGRAKSPASLASALLSLAFEDRDAVVLSAGEGLPREDAAKVVGCEATVYDARLRRGFARLAELVPAQAQMSPVGATASYAFSGLRKALELQETTAC